MPCTLTRKLIDAHLAEGRPEPGAPIALRIDQTLTQDATGTLVMLELEALGLDRVRTDVSVQYVDHNLLQADFRNADDHRFLQSACRRFGVRYSRPGNGVSHPVHMERFGVPGATLLGSDSHTCAAGGLGMLAVGAGGLEVALAMSGEPYRLTMPRVLGIELTGELPPRVSAKDVILEVLRRHGVDGGVGRVLEYHGPGVATLSAMDRHVIANMGAELGATSSVFPSDERTRAFLRRHGRGGDWRPLSADAGAVYDETDAVDLSSLVPLIAKPSSPGNVVPVTEVAGLEIGQAYIGSSANPGLRDFAAAAMMLGDAGAHPGVSLDVTPTSRGVLEAMTRVGVLGDLIRAGARIHQSGCGGCIGMGMAPATDTVSLRTVPRNFPGRSGTVDDKVYLCSPETAAASARTGVITDPRTVEAPWTPFREPDAEEPAPELIKAPDPDDIGRTPLEKGPNIASLPEFEPHPARLAVPVLLKVGDDVSTDEILPAGARVLPFRSNVQAISEFVYRDLDPRFARRARDVGGQGFVIVGGDNYGQGSSREHAAIAPRHLGLRAVVAKGFARIHRQNLINVGVLPVRFADPADHEVLEQGDELVLTGPDESGRVTLTRNSDDRGIPVACDLDRRELQVLRAGGMINHVRRRRAADHRGEASAS
ncbi:MAG TPA: aconitate hydratase [Candidatus Krumholzibacteria bacterium]|nr:aconitate hydratase [Candidatus Krumholzibacteria bacterium]HRX52065.1 aconitate hydratase [Candidatus Krumholzibacteria bacterium]